MAEPTGLSASVWLFLLREGGRWSAADIAKALSDEPLSVAANMKGMVDAQTVRRYEKVPGSSVQFGVTMDCRVPRGVTIKDILACDLIAREKEVA